MDLYGMEIIIAVHMMHSLQYYMKSGPLTQRLGQENSRKSTNIISSQCLPVSKNMNGQASFETARDTIRHEIHSRSPAQFPYGTRGTSVSALASAILALRILWPSQVL